MKFFKYHALGNDYWACFDAVDPEADAVKALCDRHYGLGGDGLLVGRPARADEPLVHLTIYNADGTTAQSSGNGLRIFGAFLADHGLLKPGGVKTVQIGRELKKVTLLECLPPKYLLRASLGPASPVEHKNFVASDGTAWDLYSVAIGNPHAVVWVDHPTRTLACTLGPQIEHACPGRTNVQFVKRLGPNSLSMEIWERGSGYTLASGSSSAAAVAVAKHLGYCDPCTPLGVAVHMPGGVLKVYEDPQEGLIVEGPVVGIGEGRLRRPGTGSWT